MPDFEVTTASRTELLDITARVQDLVARSGVTSGVCCIYVPHTTAAVMVNENCDSDVGADLLSVLDRLVPVSGRYAHREGNSDAHAKSLLVGTSQAIPVEGGRLGLGRWQGVFFCEFDGPRRRRCVVKVLNDSPASGG
jgi:secondary thiamine-phosphate synthase enzyme